MSPTLLIVCWYLLPVLPWAITLFFPRTKSSALFFSLCVATFVACVATIVAGHFLLVGHVEAIDAQLLAEADKYEPGTPEHDQAMDAWASDTGRSFAIAFSAPLTAVWYTFNFVLLFGFRWLIGYLIKKRNETAIDQAVVEGQIVES